MLQKTLQLLQMYQQHTHGGEIDELGDEMRQEIEKEIEFEDHAFFKSGDPLAEQLKPQVGKLLKDAKAKSFEKARMAARGING